jgi:hypothetical protein
LAGEYRNGRPIQEQRRTNLVTFGARSTRGPEDRRMVGVDAKNMVSSSGSSEQGSRAGRKANLIPYALVETKLTVGFEDAAGFRERMASVSAR